MEKTKLHIIVIDNDDQSAKVTSEIVKRAGFSALITSSAEAASRILDREHKRVIMILSEYQIGDQTGVDFRKQTIDRYKHIPFALIAAHLPQDIKSFDSELHISAFLTKPIDEREFGKIIEKESEERVQEIEFEEELREIYLEESIELIKEVEPLLLSLEQNPSDMDLVNAIYRLIHTIKGGCNVLENTAVSDFLHKYEDIYSAIKSHKIEASTDVISVLLNGFDKVTQLFAAFVEGDDVSDTRESLLATIQIDRSSEPVQSVADISSDEPKKASSAKPKKKEALSVPIAMLDEFMAQSGEITVIRNMVNKLVAKINKELPSSKSVQHLIELLEEMHKINAGMQNKLTEIRKVPLSDVFRPVPRAVRDLCKNTGKEVKIEIEGDALRVDTVITQVLNNSVVHMVRNSVDHGIELPNERVSKGKNAQGLLSIKSSESGENIIVEISDDGQGINAEKIKDKIKEKGLADVDVVDRLRDEDIFQYLFEPGFSTADKVTDVSGRGVGMDMVKTSIDSLGGRIDVKSKKGHGSTFRLTMPIPKSVQIINALIVTVNGFELSLPQDKVSRLLIVDEEKAGELVWKAHDSQLLNIDDSLVCVVDARAALGMPDYDRRNDEQRHFVLVRTDDNHGYALEVDSILDNESIVVKDLETCILDQGLFLGATFLGNGGVGLILDVDGIARRVGIEASEFRYGKEHPRIAAKPHYQEYISVRLNTDGLFAIRLDKIFRFERLPAKNIQYSANQPVVKYRDSIMPIYDLADALGLSVTAGFSSDQEYVSLVVMESKGLLFGMRIQSLEDVYQLNEELKPLVKPRPGLVGNMIIEGKNHVLIDIEAAVDIVREQVQPLKVTA